MSFLNNTPSSKVWHIEHVEDVMNTLTIID